MKFWTTQPSKSHTSFIIGGISLALFFCYDISPSGSDYFYLRRRKLLKSRPISPWFLNCQKMLPTLGGNMLLRLLPLNLFWKEYSFETVTSVFTGKSATGTIEVVNTLPEEISLRPGTRFQTEDGLIFRSEEWVRLRPNERATVPAVADEKDSLGKSVGDREIFSHHKNSLFLDCQFLHVEYVWEKSPKPLKEELADRFP